jgi:PAS domain S-box-containing protein
LRKHWTLRFLGVNFGRAFNSESRAIGCSLAHRKNLMNSPSHARKRPEQADLPNDVPASLRIEERCCPADPLVIDTARQLHDQKQILKSLLASGQVFSKVFYMNPIPSNMSRLSDDLIIEVNAAFEAVSGYARDEIVGRTTGSLGIWDDPEDWKRAKVVAQKDGRLRDYECRFRSKSGSLIIGLLSAEIFEVGGEHYVLAAVVDITSRRLAEHAQRASQKKLQFHLEQNLLGVVEWSVTRHIVEWNPAAENIFGFTRAEALGRNMDLVVPPDSHGDVVGVFENLENKSGGEFSINANLTKDGRRITCEWFNTPLLADDGSVCGVISLVRDVTRQQQTLEALKLSEECFSKAFNQSPLMKSIFDMDEGRYVEINQQYEHVTGFSRSEIVGKTLDEVCIWEDMDLVRSALSEAQTTGAYHDYEGALRTKSGEIRIARCSGHKIKIGGKACLLSSF